MIYIPSLPQRYADVAHYVAGYHPALFYPLARRRRRRTSGRFVDRDCGVVIEGFPRVGSTYAVEAFRHVQPSPPEIASHVHVPAQVMRGVRLGLPTLVLIREPEATVRSLLVKHPFIRPRDALRGYWLFYRWILRFAPGFVAADFTEVTRDFGRVVARVNARFGTEFALFEHSEQAEAAVASRLADIDATAGQGPRESAGPRPEKDRAKAAIDLAPHTAWLARCRRLYERFPRAAASRAGAD